MSPFCGYSIGTFLSYVICIYALLLQIAIPTQKKKSEKKKIRASSFSIVIPANVDRSIYIALPN